MTVNIAINGFGRIGRAVLRAIFEGKYDINCVAINTGAKSPALNAHLFKYDSTHGRFKNASLIDDETLEVAGKKIKIISEIDPEKINWSDLGVDIVLECTGKFTKKDLAMKHIKSGAKKVLVSAPCDDADAVIVYGVNHIVLKGDEQVISVGSCTTNCLAPMAKILNDNFSILSGSMTTVHAYTSDQMLLDGLHNDFRRARSAALSMVPASTGAAKAIGLVIPELAGKLDGSAIRVPVQNVSIVELVCTLAKSASKDEINALFKDAAAGSYKGVLNYNEEPLVSIDFNHSTFSTEFDATQTKVINQTLYKVSGWYDNEWGFSNRMLDVASVV
ncbi:MAG: type I glyceraldehyde-3-phosphate dehydrogenase [Alphaproteobacteria bacterium]|nr:type I glyceraldehyde-3-phosphate dehydrogenase [Candidatus Jidaibacter sp.]